ncbi:MAG TPA: hypothetical protein VK453_11880 [Micromonosporaceae bacterium]|nr:hypothetical protein [Micromonosporaceae bacterium]
MMNRFVPPIPSDDPLTAECAARYHHDRTRRYAFVFHVPITATRFTALAANPDRYAITETYTMTLTAPNELPLVLSAEQWDFLRNCLRTTELRWQEAIAEADAGAAQPPRGGSPPADQVNVEPTRAGYRVIGARFRDEADRVRELIQRIDHLLRNAVQGG